MKKFFSFGRIIVAFVTTFFVTMIVWGFWCPISPHNQAEKYRREQAAAETRCMEKGGVFYSGVCGHFTPLE